MKRNIKDLKPNEAIQISTKKELKAISKLTFKPIATNAPCYYFKYNDEMNGFKTETNSNVIYPASDYIHKPKKSRLDKIEERLKALEKGLPSTVTYSEDGKVSIRISEQDMPQPKLINYGGVEEVLTELPEKWFVRHSHEALQWIKINAEKNGNNITEQPYYLFPANRHGNNSSLMFPDYEGYTEITTEQFKKWVLGEEKEFKTETWYIHPHTKSILYVPKNRNCYGFDEHGDWIEINMSGITFACWKPSTEQEVSDALIAEAKRRGFKDGVEFNKIGLSLKRTIDCFDETFFNIRTNTVYAGTPESEWDIDGVSNVPIFKKGVWAEIIDKPETEIDWSKPGQLVKGKDVIILTSGHGTTEAYDSFSGIVVNSVEIYKKGHYSGTWNASQFKLYTGEPITLTP